MSDPTNNQILAELQEDYRREQFHSWMKQYGGIVLGLALLAVAATGGYSFWKHYQESRQQEVTAELYKGLGAKAEQNPIEAAAALNNFAAQYPDSGQAVMATLLEAGLHLKAEQPQQALEKFDAVIGNAKADKSMKAVASLSYVETALNMDIPADQLQAKLAPYQSADSAFRFSAWELGALVAHKFGDRDKAQGFLAQITGDENAPPTLKDRATELKRVL